MTTLSPAGLMIEGDDCRIAARGRASPRLILMAKSEIAENITAGWSDRGPFATSIRSFDDFAISIKAVEEPNTLFVLLGDRL